MFKPPAIPLKSLPKMKCPMLMLIIYSIIPNIPIISVINKQSLKSFWLNFRILVLIKDPTRQPNGKAEVINPVKRAISESLNQPFRLEICC